MSSKQREALEKCVRRLDAITPYLPLEFRKYVFADIQEAKAALTEPVLNCEVGTMAEQSKRHERYCTLHTTNERCVKCPLWQMRLLGINCAVAWANFPYEKEGEK